MTNEHSYSVYWLKDSVKIENNPDYKTHRDSDGQCTLTIDETFTEDSAKYSCKAINGLGVSETNGRLTVSGEFFLLDYAHDS